MNSNGTCKALPKQARISRRSLAFIFLFLSSAGAYNFLLHCAGSQSTVVRICNTLSSLIPGKLLMVQALQMLALVVCVCPAFQSTTRRINERHTKLTGLSVQAQANNGVSPTLIHSSFVYSDCHAASEQQLRVLLAGCTQTMLPVHGACLKCCSARTVLPIHMLRN